ncbi:hypothetical protein CC79DRAFT_1292772 [Sarocladium strictum]
MPPKSTTRKATSGGTRVGRQGPKQATCKTCSACRQKKVKCSGARPKCDECISHDTDCLYPRDARREPRPSRARLQTLEATMSAMLEHMKTSGISAPGLEDAIRAGTADLATELQSERGEEEAGRIATPESTPSVHLPTPTASSITFSELPRSFGDSPVTVGQLSTYSAPSVTNQQAEYQGTQQMDREPAAAFRSPLPTNPQPRAQNPTCQRVADEDEVQTNSLSPCEARVAGVFHEHGRVTSVHGLSGIINPTRRALHKENISKVSRKGEVAVSSSKARLISNAILQKQRENRLFRQPQQSIDLDGCEPELARHLIDLHFNRHYCAYIITYRPAILDSIANGGPWVNKLLLNSIYYNSSLYSDRIRLRSSQNDPESVGSRFYDRFSQLLVEAMGKPSIPSAVALLLTSATLVAQGKVSAGWTLSGTAYRMIIDLGCHMMLAADYQEVGSQSSAQALQKDIDCEMRKRLYWGAYCMDVTQSLFLGRQCSFATTEARVPLQLLDTFEELEEWTPYVDPTENGVQPAQYSPQPTYAISNFSCSVKLMQIGALVSDLYGISTVGYRTEVVLEKKAAIETQLENWVRARPEHLVFDPDGDNVPPPHQVTPYTTFHTLRILLYRAFMEEGHLRRHSDASAKHLSEQECIASALMIEKYIRAYRNTFTLRRAPFLMSYAIYSAVSIILPQERHDRGHFTDLIAFFWTCLGELQHGCNSGLKKPLSVLRDMAREFQLSAKERAPSMATEGLDFTLDESFFPQLPLATPSVDNDVYSAAQYLHEMNGQQGGMGGGDGFETGTESMTPGLMNFLNDQEWDISQNTLYGLFAPTQSF